MNTNFAGSHLGGESNESKNSIAREVLNTLVNRGQDDLFGMLSFSTSPVYTLPLTKDHTAVSAAIRDATTGSHGVTNITPALSSALDLFYTETVAGSRAVLLVSDGASILEPETQELLRQQFSENHVALYWIYLRTQNANSLATKPKNPNERTSPEHSLHRFFQSLNTLYQAFEVENPVALKQAIQTIKQMENQPIRYFEKTPGVDLSQYFYTIALVIVLILLGLKTMEVKVWN
ncbi:MAG: vWA domain-containing protein [Methylococcales bacterium]